MADLILTKITDDTKVIASVEDNYLAIKNVNASQVELVTQQNALFVSIQDQSITYDANFEYTQSSASNYWEVNHNLGKYCSVMVVDNNGEVIYGNVVYNTKNKLTITFNAQITGKAYLN
jgi:hypothetical protein